MSENRDAPLKRSSGSPRAAGASPGAAEKKRASRAKNTATTETKDNVTKGPPRKRAAGEPATRRSHGTDAAKTGRETTTPAKARARTAETTTSRPRRKRASEPTQSPPGAEGTQNNAAAGQSPRDETQSEPKRVSPDERRDMIRRIAYFRAQWRGWMPGAELDDWLHAEREVDAMLRGDRTD